jgi:outer membrane protein insertion porin family
VGLIFMLAITAGANWAAGQGVDPVGRPIAAVRVAGNDRVSPQLVLNQVRVKAGQPYDPQTVARDIQNITRLGRFASVRADVQQREDGSVVLTYLVEEQPLLADVQVVGNKAKSDQDLMKMVLLRGGDPRDDFLIERGVDQIRKEYRDAGYFLAEVSVDKKTLDESDVLIFRVREGPRVKVRGLRFEGNEKFPTKQLKTAVGTKKHVFILEKGILSNDQLDKDVASLRGFYEDRGYLDIRVGRRIDISDDQNDAVVVYILDEGRQYTVGKIDYQIEGPGVFSPEMIAEAMPMKTGDVYSAKKLRQTQEALRDLYGKIGYLATQEGGKNALVIERVFDETDPKVHLIISVVEGKQYKVGDVIIRGNSTTQDRVARRQIRGLEPGRPYDRAGIERSRRNIRESGIFNEAKITVLGEEEQEYRDLLVEVREAKTGSVSFGAAVSSDAGVVGSINLAQRNFDITDWPESWSELISGRAFKGAGQQFNLSIQPGAELQRYSVSWSDPYIFDSSYFVGGTAQYFTRARENFDEERFGGFGRVGKRFGDTWSATASFRYENIGIDDVEGDAPVDVFAVRGDSTISGLGLSVARSTVDSRLFPTRGSRASVGFERTGVFGGDYDFTKIFAEGKVFFTVDEDFFGRKTVLSFRSEFGYILEDDEAPLFERFYAGGHHSFRGFAFRGVGPRGIRADQPGVLGDDAVGGEWLFLLGSEYNFPIYQEFVRGVFFVDSGTVQEDFGFDEYRVSVGAGVRLKLPFLGQAPFAFDFAYPLIKEDTDQERFFSFSVALPF